MEEIAYWYKYEVRSITDIAAQSQGDVQCVQTWFVNFKTEKGTFLVSVRCQFNYV